MDLLGGTLRWGAGECTNRHAKVGARGLGVR